jgi:voltage-gated potassium channel
MIFLVLTTIATLIYEVNHPVIPILIDYEYFAVSVFALEWLARLWVYSDVRKTFIKDYEETLFFGKEYKLGISFRKATKEKFEYILSPMSIIDLLAILPAYRPLRFLRIFLLFRLLKILRYTSAIKEFSSVFHERRFELFTLALLVVMVIFFGSTVMFVYEGNGENEKLKDYFDAVYWAVITATTVGYGDIVPVTIEGKFATAVLVIAGILTIAFSTSIVTTSLVERIELIKQARVENEVQKLKTFTIICGYKILSKYLVEELLKQNKKILIIEDNEEKVIKAKNNGLLTMKGDATDTDFLRKIGVGRNVDTIIAVEEDDATNLSIVLGARMLDPNIQIITLVNESEVENKLKLAGADFIVNSNQISAYVASEYIGQPVAFEAVDGILLEGDMSAEVNEIEIVEGMNVINKNISAINFEDYNLTLIGVINRSNDNEFIFNPINTGYILQEKDILIVIGYKQSLKDLKTDFLSKFF